MENSFKKIVEKAKKATRIAKVAIPFTVASLAPSEKSYSQTKDSNPKNVKNYFEEITKRLKAKEDSTFLYKNYEELKKELNRQRYIKEDSYTEKDAKEKWENLKDGNKKEGRSEKYSKTLYKTRDFIPEIINNTLPEQYYSDGIDPVGVDVYHMTEEGLKLDDPRSGDFRDVAVYNIKPIENEYDSNLWGWTGFNGIVGYYNMGDNNGRIDVTIDDVRGMTDEQFKQIFPNTRQNKQDIINLYETKQKVQEKRNEVLKNFEKSQ